jgi:hypothetical protein
MAAVADVQHHFRVPRAPSHQNFPNQLILLLGIEPVKMDVGVSKGPGLFRRRTAREFGGFPNRQVVLKASRLVVIGPITASYAWNRHRLARRIAPWTPRQSVHETITTLWQNTWAAPSLANQSTASVLTHSGFHRAPSLR